MTDKKADVWMPLWIGAYLGDTMKLTTLQHGAYLLLLIAYWRDRKPLPDDDEELRAITKTDKAEWKKLRPKLEGFFRVADGVWWHKRVEAEMQEADKRANAASSKAQAAAQARWGKSQSSAKSNAPSMLQALPEQCPVPTPTPVNTPIPPDGGMPPLTSSPPALYPADPMPPVAQHVLSLGEPPAPPPAPAPRKAAAAVEDVTPDAIAAWLQVRTRKRAGPINSIVLAGLDREREKAGLTRQQAVEACVEYGWIALTAEWYLQRNGAAPRGKTTATSHTGLTSRNYQEGIDDDGSIL